MRAEDQEPLSHGERRRGVLLWVFVFLFLLIGFGGIIAAVLYGKSSDHNSASAASSAAATKVAVDKLNTFTINAHRNNVQSQDEIKYLLGVVAYQQGALLSLHADTATELSQIKTVESEAIAALTVGQNQLLGYLQQLPAIQAQLSAIRGCLATQTPAACAA